MKPKTPKKPSLNSKQKFLFRKKNNSYKTKKHSSNLRNKTLLPKKPCIMASSESLRIHAMMKCEGKKIYFLT